MSSSHTGAFQVTRLIVSALAGGVVVLWVVAWVMTDGGSAGFQPDAMPGSLALMVWAAVALPAFGGALYFRGRAAGTAGRVGGTDGRTGTERGASMGSRAHTYTILAHALLEGPALLAGAFSLLLGTTPVVWVALPVYLLGLVLTWPSADWFRDAPR